MKTNKEKSNWLWFRADEPETIAEWEKTTGELLGRVLGLDHTLKIKLRLPKIEDAQEAWNANLDLLGEVRIVEPGGDAGERLKIHLPIDGVFIASGNTDNRPQAKVWDSWLGEKPGVRLIKPCGRHLNDAGIVWWRIGFPVGSHIEYRGEVRPQAERGDEDSEWMNVRRISFGRRAKFALAVSAEAYPEGLRREFEKEEVSEESVREWCCANVETLRVWTRTNATEETLRFAGQTSAVGFDGLTDRDDLNYRPLFTFPIWLRQRLCWRFWNERRAWKEDKGVFNWRDKDLLQRVAFGLVPLRESGRKKLTGLSLISPENPIELISAMTGVKRFRVNRDDALTYSVDYRQNHASFDGRLCPIESPESEMVGIALQLSRKARVGSDGIIIPATGDKVLDKVGWGMAMIPFSHHNDGARNMMGAKNLRQVLPVHGAQAPCVRTGAEGELVRLTDDLAQIGICPKCSDTHGHFLAGRDLLVAYMPWYGWNVDDAIVVSKSVVDPMTVTKRKRFSRFVTPGWTVESEAHSAGDEIRHGDVIARIAGPNGESVELKYLDDGAARLVVPPSFSAGSHCSDSVSYRLEYEIERDFPLGVGDKLMGRHGNKGVVSRIEEADRMPRLPKDGEPGAERLPEALRGRHVDVLLNPHGVISRMNPSQLLETHLSWLMKNGCCKIAEFFKGSGDAVGVPEVGMIDHEKVMDLLKGSGLDETGKISLYFNDGSKTEQPIVVGYQHFVRLNHIPALKSQARRGGEGASYAMNTLQAKHGRSVGGGQRVGEMEVWALAAHQADFILAEMLGPKSNMQLAGKWTDVNQIPRGNFREGFPSTMRDWLRAMMIEFSVDPVDKLAKMSVLADVGAELGSSREVVRDGGMELWKTAEYGCDGNGYAECDSCIARYLQGKMLRMSTTGMQRGLTVESLLEGYGVRLAGKIISDGDGKFVQSVQDPATLQPCGLLRLETCGNSKSSVTFKMSLKDMNLVRFPSKVESVYAYCHCVAEKKLSNLTSGADSIGDFYITCAHIRSHAISARSGTKIGEKVVTVDGGLYDERIFGSCTNAAAGTDHDKWGWIRIPESAKVYFPSFLFGGEKDGRKFLQRISAGDQELSLVKSIPVLPIWYRCPTRITGGFRFDKIDAQGYGRILRAIRRYEKANPKKRNAEDIQIAVDCLISRLLKQFCGKEGLLRRHGLGRRVDRSMRMVITPNPVMKWDEVRVPFTVLWEVMGDLVCREQNRQDLLESARGHGVGWSWPKSENDDSRKADRRRTLERYLEEHEESGDPIYLLMNRQPSLHRDSFQAFRVGLLDDAVGDAEVFQISPLCCKGFGADFDGDEMVGHLPVSRQAREEAKKLSPSETSLSNGMVLIDDEQPTVSYGALPLANFDRDFVSGEFLKDGRTSKNFRVEVLKKWIGGISADEISAEASDAFKRITDNGLSFGYYDLYRLRKELNRGTGFREWLARDINRETSAIEIIVKSRANGFKQIGQLIDRRGELEAVGRPIDKPLLDGLPWTDIFDASWNARASMCAKKLGTGMAGDLTRKLVLALWGIAVSEDCCSLSDAERGDGLSILKCRSTNGICAACYNKLAPVGLKAVKKGFPAGIMAALSLGERGTQLSMKGAHTGGVEIDIDDVKSLLLRGQLPDSPDSSERNRMLVESGVEDGWPLFLAAIAGGADGKKFTPYHEVDVRHLQLVWRALHMRAIQETMTNPQACKIKNGRKNKLGKASDLYSDDLVTRLAAIRQKEVIGKLLDVKRPRQPFTLNSPIGYVLFNLFGDGRDQTGA